MMTNEYKSCSQDTIYSAARPPITAAPIIPQAAVSRGTAAPLEVEVDAALVAELVEEAEEVVEVLEELEPLWASPSAVDSLAWRRAAAPERGVALTPVLFAQTDAETSSLVRVEVKVTSAHY